MKLVYHICKMLICNSIKVSQAKNPLLNNFQVLFLRRFCLLEIVGISFM
jgi:hypothetical protein